MPFIWLKFRLAHSPFQNTVANLKAASVQVCPHLNFGWIKRQIHSWVLLLCSLSSCLSLSHPPSLCLSLYSINLLCTIASCLLTAWQVRSEKRLSQVGLISGLDMWEECHLEIIAQGYETWPKSIKRYTCRFTHTLTHPHCINSRQSYPVILLLMKSALMTWI